MRSAHIWMFCLCVALPFGCGNGGANGGDQGGGGGAAGSGGISGAGGSAGTGGSSASGGTAGMAGRGGEPGAPSAMELVSANVQLMLELCDCSVGETPFGSIDPVCFAEIPGPLPGPEQLPCLDAVIASSTSAQEWTACRMEAAVNGEACWSEVDGCDGDMYDLCREAFVSDFASCSLTTEDEAAIDACLTPDPETLLQLLRRTLSEGCECVPDPATCLATIEYSSAERTCIVETINQGLESSNPTVSQSTAETLRCLQEQYLRWGACLQRVDLCEPSDLEACSDRYGPFVASCAFPDDPPEMVASALAGCSM